MNIVGLRRKKGTSILIPKWSTTCFRYFERPSHLVNRSCHPSVYTSGQHDAISVARPPIRKVMQSCRRLRRVDVKRHPQRGSLPLHRSQTPELLRNAPPSGRFRRFNQSLVPSSNSKRFPDQIQPTSSSLAAPSKLFA